MKARLPYFIAVTITMILGLSSRRFSGVLPAFASEHAGDALWAGMIYFGVRTVWVRKRLLPAALISALFCLGIELSQLYQADWINGIRSTFLGALVLGSGFLTVDLARYSVGIGLSLLIDGYFSKRGHRG